MEVARLQEGVRKLVLEQSYRAGVGHIGSALSIVDLVAAIYAGLLRGQGGDDQERDRFVLSKGHAALAMYAAMYLSGAVSREQLDSYCGDGSLLGVHPEAELPGVDFSTGSLGHGLSMGVGSALAARLRASSRKTFVLLSDAECNAGSTWEAVMFAAHHQLDNLVAVVDVNGQQALGYTEDVLDLSPLDERWRAFGWAVSKVDGHDPDSIIARTETPPGPGPHVILAATTFGHGVSYMEGQIRWHYLPMDEGQYGQALDEIESL